MVERLITCSATGELPTLVKTWLDTQYTGGGGGGAVDSVNGQTGVVVLNKTDVGLGSVDNVADAEKAVLAAAKLATARTINGVAFDGTADITVPAVDASKEPIISAGTTAQYWRGDKTWVALDKTAVGLGSVDNTTDAAKPISTATQTALNLLAPKANPTFTGTVAGVTKTHVGLGSADNTADSAKAVLSATKLATPRAINGVNFDGTAAITVADGTKEPALPGGGTTAHYLRGDKSWQTHDKASVGLANVDNTADAAKAVLSATKLATVRTINGVAFDGTGNITIPDTGEPTITAGTTAQYWRGDKSWQTHDKASIGLGSVDNTSDATKDAASTTLTNKTLTDPKINWIKDTSGASVLEIYPIPGSVNYVRFFGNTAGQGVGISSGGTDTNVDLSLLSKGTGIVNANGVPVVTTTGTQTLTNKTLTSPAISSPAISGTPTGITAAHVGLGSVNNTADTAKPVSTAQQTALDTKVTGRTTSSQTTAALSLWKGSQAEYDAIGTKDGNTVYVVT